jgi:mannosyl-3-phosphoglycerate synthase
MRIELPRKSERFGANVFYAPVQAYELDCGVKDEPESEQRSVVAFTHDDIYDIQRDMAVVVPVREERVRLIEGILFAIPSQCLIIVVSNSPRAPVDRFRIEQLAVERFARMARKRLILTHQKDPVVARAFIESGYPELVGHDGLVRDGKGEGMLIATVLAHLAGRRYVGFVDADNYSPGSAYEYVREYAAGFALASSPYAMVRILWQSKPKIVGGDLYFARWGRTSRVTNQFLNALIGHYTGFETDVVCTGNAGEHALTLALALRLDYGSGYSVEPQHIVSLLESFGGELDCPFPEVLRHGVDIIQVESRSPHFHQAGEDDHIHDMARVALGAIHGSSLCPDDLRRGMEEALCREGILEAGGTLEPPMRYPRLSRVDFEAFRRVISEEQHLLFPGPGSSPEALARSERVTVPRRWRRGRERPGGTRPRKG